MIKRIFPIFISLLPIFAHCQVKDTFLLFYLGGQSNMEGFGYNVDLPEHLSQPMRGVWIFHGNPVGDDRKDGGIGKWEALIRLMKF